MSASPSPRYPLSSLLKAGSAAVLAAVIVNTAARLLVGALFSLNPGFLPLTIGSIISITFIFCVIGVLVLLVVNRFSARPLKVYNLVAIAALVISLIPNLTGTANPAAIPMGGTGTDYLILVFFHLTAAAGFLFTLNKILQKA